MELVFCGVVCGNVNEFGDGGGGFGKSFFFFVRDGFFGIGLFGDRDFCFCKVLWFLWCLVYFCCFLKI